jgi:hypothetical protein
LGLTAFCFGVPISPSPAIFFIVRGY